MVTIRSLRKDRYPIIDDRNSTNICLKPFGRAICHTNEDAVTDPTEIAGWSMDAFSRESHLNKTNGFEIFET